MTTPEFVARLAARHVRLSVEGDRLRCSAPKGTLTEDIRAELAARKTEIIAWLQQGRYSDARNAFLLALQHDPENPEIQRAVQLADQLCGRSPLELAL